MKKLISFLMAFIFVAFCFSACSKSPESNQTDMNRDAQGYVQFIADFHTRLFAITNNPNSELAYYPLNPKLETSFSYGSYDLAFSAEYQKNKIVYNVTNPTEDRVAERNTFDEIYDVYSASWNNYIEKTSVGAVSESDENDVQTIVLLLSGSKFTVSFSPLAETPTIVYEIIEIA